MTTTTSPAQTQDLSEGALGMALLPIERGDLPAARRLLARAVANGVSAGGNASLFHGAPALEFVFGCAGRAGRSVRDAVDRVVDARLAAARRRQESGALPGLAEFDLVRGLTGLGRLLLAREAPSPRLDDVLASLVSLARPVRTEGREWPGWWSPVGPGGEEMPGGHGNNGMAHGVAGVLALLSLAERRDARVPGQQDAMSVLARWLATYGGWYWIDQAQLDAVHQPDPQIARPSWCYGPPGIARARQLAALALNDPAAQRAAEDTLVRTLSDPVELARVTDATLCHGWAGLLTLTEAAAADSRTPGRFAPVIDSLRRRLAEHADRLTKPGFLEGRAGAQLALTGTHRTPWATALLIT